MQKIIRTNGLLDVSTLALPSLAEHCLTVCDNDVLAMNRILRNAAQELKAVPLTRFVFAGLNHYDNFRKNTSPSDDLITWLHGDACKGGEISSMQCFAV
ncbi:MAG: hypothetical protein WC637_09440, partial [Victivallales bacterium]